MVNRECDYLRTESRNARLAAQASLIGGLATLPRLADPGYWWRHHRRASIVAICGSAAAIAAGVYVTRTAPEPQVSTSSLETPEPRGHRWKRRMRRVVRDAGGALRRAALRAVFVRILTDMSGNDLPAPGAEEVSGPT